MKKDKLFANLVILATTTTFIAFPAKLRASLFSIEPFIDGIISGETDDTSNFLPPNPPSFKDSGTISGVRLGVDFRGFFLGVEYALGSYETESSRPDFFSVDVEDHSDEWKGTHLGLFVGHKFPLSLRIWGTYYVSSKLEDQDPTTGIFGGGSVTNLTYSGTGFALGLALTSLPLLNLNLEWRTFSYDEVEITSSNGASTDAFTGASKRNTEAISIGVSFPITF